MQCQSTHLRLSAFRVFLPLTVLCFWPSADGRAQPADPIYLVDASIACYGEAKDINDAGEATGRYSLPGSCYEWKTFYWTAADGLEEIAASCGELRWPVAINASGQVLGLCELAGPWPKKRVTFLWSRDAGLTVLQLDNGVVCGTDDSAVPVDINNSGEIIGFCEQRTSPFTRTPFHWSPLAGGTNLGTFEESSAVPMDISNTGDVLIVAHSVGLDRPLVWNAIGPSTRFLDTTDDLVRAYEINDLGQVAGMHGYRASVWEADGSLIDIHPVGNPFRGYAYSINNAGQVVGAVRTDTSYLSYHESFIWSETDGLQLAGDAGTDSADACGVQPVWVGPINDDGNFVGTRRTMLNNHCEGAFAHTTYYWTADDGMVDLMATGAIDGFTMGLNNNGQVTGIYDGLAVLWNIPSGPMTPDEEIEIVKDLIDELVTSGSLNDGQGTSLNSKLDASASKLSDGHTTPGCKILEAFIREIRAKMNSGEMTQAEGEAVIAAANDVSACSS